MTVGFEEIVIPILNPHSPKSFAIPLMTWMLGYLIAYEAADMVYPALQVLRYTSSKIMWNLLLS